MVGVGLHTYTHSLSQSIHLYSSSGSSNSSGSMIMKCYKCGHGWTYRGNNSITATCPDCKGTLKIAQAFISMGSDSR